MLNKNYFISELQRIRALVIVNIFVDCFGLFCLLPLCQCSILNCFCFWIFLSSFVLFSSFLSFDPCFRFAFSICFSFLILSNSARSSVFFFDYSIAFFLIFANTGFPSCCCFLSFTLYLFQAELRVSFPHDLYTIPSNHLPLQRMVENVCQLFSSYLLLAIVKGKQ